MYTSKKKFSKKKSNKLNKISNKISNLFARIWKKNIREKKKKENQTVNKGKNWSQQKARILWQRRKTAKSNNKNASCASKQSTIKGRLFHCDSKIGSSGNERRGYGGEEGRSYGGWTSYPSPYPSLSKVSPVFISLRSPPPPSSLEKFWLRNWSKIEEISGKNSIRNQSFHFIYSFHLIKKKTATATKKFLYRKKTAEIKQKNFFLPRRKKTTDEKKRKKFKQKLKKTRTKRKKQLIKKNKPEVVFKLQIP